MSFCGTKPSIGRIKRIKQDAVHAIYSSKDQVMNQNKKKKNYFPSFQQWDIMKEIRVKPIIMVEINITVKEQNRNLKR